MKLIAHPCILCVYVHELKYDAHVCDRTVTPLKQRKNTYMHVCLFVDAAFSTLVLLLLALFLFDFHTPRIILVCAQQVAMLSMQKFSSNVIEKCMDRASEEIIVAYVHELADDAAMRPLLQVRDTAPSLSPYLRSVFVVNNLGALLYPPPPPPLHLEKQPTINAHDNSNNNHHRCRHRCRHHDNHTSSKSSTTTLPPSPCVTFIRDHHNS